MGAFSVTPNTYFHIENFSKAKGNASALWRALCINREALGLPATVSFDFGEESPWDDVLRAVENGQELPGAFRGDRMWVPSISSSGVYVGFDRSEYTFDFDAWVRIVGGAFPWTQAWMIDGHFTYLQNEILISNLIASNEYRTNVAHRKSGLPPPFEWEIDTSRNPGRTARHDHYLEVVGSTMWFADGFWALVGKRRDQFSLDRKHGRVDDFDNASIKIVAAKSPFCDESKRETMDALRKAIFDVAPPAPWPDPLPLDARGPEWRPKKVGFFSKLFKS